MPTLSPPALKRFFQPQRLPMLPSVALLLLRLVIGTAFMFYGSGKIMKPFNWMPDSPIPGFLQALAAVSEFFGGLALIIGLLTPLAALGIAITMVVATGMLAFAMKLPFVDLTGGHGFDLPLTFLAVALVFVTLGAGKLSLDRLFFKERD
jgi:putative oxidoreductase